MKLRTILSMLVGIMVSTTGNAITTTTTLNVSATISATCTASASPVAFQIPASNYANGSINVTCASNTPYSIDLNGGQYYEANNTSPMPFVTDGQGNGMGYELFSDSNYNSLWGDGNVTAAGQPVSSTGTGSPQTFTVYGAIFPDTNFVGSPSAGNTYNDVVTATINY